MSRIAGATLPAQKTRKDDHTYHPFMIEGTSGLERALLYRRRAVGRGIKGPAPRTECRKGAREYQPVTNDADSRPVGRRLSPWRLLPLAVIVAGLVAFFALGLGEYLSFTALSEHRQALLSWYEDNTLQFVGGFLVLYVVVVAFSVPGAVWMTIGGGFVFGLVLGTALVVVAATVGAVVLFLVARYAIGDYLRSKAGPAMRRMEAGFRENELSYLLVLRLVPLFPFWLVNLVPAFLGVSLRTFVAGTFFGIIPGSFVYVSVGNGLGAVFDAGGAPDLGHGRIKRTGACVPWRAD